MVRITVLVAAFATLLCSAAVAQTKLFERANEFRDHVRRQRERGVPIGFRPILTVAFEAGDPVLNVHRRAFPALM